MPLFEMVIDKKVASTRLGGLAYAEAEEFLIGPMDHMDRYLLRIEIKQKYYDRVAKEHPEYAKPLIDHPKLTVL